MKRNNQGSEIAVANGAPGEDQNSERNGSSVLVAEPGSIDLSVILASLQTMKDGDFSVRLPGSWTGLAGKIADTFNFIVSANQQMADELKRVGQVVGKEGRTRERTRFHESRGSVGRDGGFGQYAGGGLAPPNRGCNPQRSPPLLRET